MDINALIQERDELVLALNDESLADDVQDQKIERAKELSAQITEHNDRVAAANEARAKLAAASPAKVVTPTRVTGADEDGLPAGHMTAREAVRKISQDRSFEKFRLGGGHGTASVQLDSEMTRALFGSVLAKRTLFDDVDSVVQPTPTPGIVGPLDRPLRVADLFDRQSTSAGALTYVRDTSSTPQGSPSTVAPGGTMPESEYTFEVVNVAFSKIAHVLPVVFEALEDNNQLEGYLRGRMTYALEYAVDDQLLNGDGIGNHIEGILAVGTPDTEPNNEEVVVSLRHAKTLAQLANVNDADLSVVLNPADWEKVELAQAVDSGVFLSGTAAYAGVGPRIWGMPVVTTNAIAEGTGIVGAFRQATIWDRMSATVSISDSNKDYFESNILTLRAELRLALATYQPEAFTVVTFDPPA